VLVLTHPQDDDTTGHLQKMHMKAAWASPPSRRFCCCVVNLSTPTAMVHPSPICG
jgi:hypothetical protein